MSYFATITGYLRYRTAGHHQAALDRLQTGGWLDEKYRWYAQGQTGLPSHAPTIDEDDLLLVIPPDHYRNLGRVTTELFPGAVAGVLVSSSTDGCFDAWIERPRPNAASVPPRPRRRPYPCLDDRPYRPRGVRSRAGPGGEVARIDRPRTVQQVAGARPSGVPPNARSSLTGRCTLRVNAPLLVQGQWFLVPGSSGGTSVMVTPALQTAPGRRSFITSVISAFERDDPIGSDLVVDEDGLLAAAFTANPDRRLYYVERVDPDASEGFRCLVVRPNRSRHLTQDPMELARGDPFESRVSPQAFVYALSTESFVQLGDLRAVRREVLAVVGHGRRPLHTQQVRSNRQLSRLYERAFISPDSGPEEL